MVTSPLLRLPPEIRNQIMQLVIGHPCIRITSQQTDDSITSDTHEHREPLLHKTSSIQSDRRPLCYLTRPEPEPDCFAGHSFEPSPQLGLTMIHRTCRQLYHETSMLLYSQPVFSFGDSAATQEWLRGLRPSQRQAIRSLRLRPRQIEAHRLQQAHLPGVELIYMWSERRVEAAERWAENGVTVWYKDRESGWSEVEECDERSYCVLPKEIWD